MADIADQAQEDMERDAAGFLARAMKPNGPAANGFCHWCEEPIGENRRWCRGTDCRDQYERAQAARQRNGGRTL